MNDRLNYLHNDRNLDCLYKVSSDDLSSIKTKKELISQLFLASECTEDYLRKVLSCYSRELPELKENLKRDVLDSWGHRNDFRQLGYRGFSYLFDSEVRLLWPKVRPHINLAMGLMTRENLFYPEEVRKGLLKYHTNHLRQKGNPSIGFVLGRITSQGWFIFIIQSDIMFNKSASIREHFRGWRKLLIMKVLEKAYGKTDTIYLCPAESVIETCKPKSKPQEVPKSWLNLYNKTARDFGMKRVIITKEVDIQCFEREKSVFSKDFFELKI